MDHSTHSNATNSWLFLIWITNWAMEPFANEKTCTLISKMQEATTTKTTIKDQIIEKNVMPNFLYIDCIGFGGKSHHN